MATKKKRNTSWRKTKKVSKGRGGPISKMGKKKFLAEYRGLLTKRRKKKANPKRKSNPLPVGKLVTVKAMRRADGKIDLYR